MSRSWQISKGNTPVNKKIMTSKVRLRVVNRARQLSTDSHEICTIKRKYIKQNMTRTRSLKWLRLRFWTSCQNDTVSADIKKWERLHIVASYDRQGRYPRGCFHPRRYRYWLSRIKWERDAVSLSPRVVWRVLKMTLNCSHIVSSATLCFRHCLSLPARCHRKNMVILDKSCWVSKVFRTSYSALASRHWVLVARGACHCRSRGAWMSFWKLSARWCRWIVSRPVYFLLTWMESLSFSLSARRAEWSVLSCWSCGKHICLRFEDGRGEKLSWACGFPMLSPHVKRCPLPVQLEKSTFRLVPPPLPISQREQGFQRGGVAISQWRLLGPTICSYRLMMEAGCLLIMCLWLGESMVWPKKQFLLISKSALRRLCWITSRVGVRLTWWSGDMNWIQTLWQKSSHRLLLLQKWTRKDNLNARFLRFRWWGCQRISSLLASCADKDEEIFLEPFWQKIASSSRWKNREDALLQLPLDSLGNGDCRVQGKMTNGGESCGCGTVLSMTLKGSPWPSSCCPIYATSTELCGAVVFSFYWLYRTMWLRAEHDVKLYRGASEVVLLCIQIRMDGYGKVRL